MFAGKSDHELLASINPRGGQPRVGQRPRALLEFRTA